MRIIALLLFLTISAEANQAKKVRLTSCKSLCVVIESQNADMGAMLPSVFMQNANIQIVDQNKIVKRSFLASESYHPLGGNTFYFRGISGNPHSEGLLDLDTGDLDLL